MPDGSRYMVPTIFIARNRAAHYQSEFGDDIDRSLQEDTIPTFEEDPYEIEDWAANNMNWSDVEEVAELMERPLPALDFQEGWVNGEKELQD